MDEHRDYLRANALSRVGRLAAAEAAVFRMLAAGMGTKAIAKALHRSPKTISNQRTTIYRKTGAEGAVASCVLAIRAGWMDVFEVEGGNAAGSKPHGGAGRNS